MGKVIEVENLSKQYRLGLVNSGTIKDDVTKWWYQLRGKENPLLKIGETNDRSSKGESDYVWSLKDINFSVEQGDVLGIIGKNGAGKSTLLKILSKVTAPTTGAVKTKGRVASLLEVGTGFHPELTGLENIYLNGAILGMRRNEIKQKLDEIVAFAGVERYVNTPVKRYSSGMYVRLAFAVAAHLESEILIIDEVLAVGDAEFQRKCLGKMESISSGKKKTILFVSHNIQSVSHLCNTGLLLQNGLIRNQGKIDDCIKDYVVSSRVRNLAGIAMEDRLTRNNMKAMFQSAIASADGMECWTFPYDKDVNFEFEIDILDTVTGILLYSELRHSFTGEKITNCYSVVDESKLYQGEKLKIVFRIPARTVRPGQYALYFALASPDRKTFYDVIDENINLPFLNIDPISMDVHLNEGLITIPFSMNAKKIIGINKE